MTPIRRASLLVAAALLVSSVVAFTAEAPRPAVARAIKSGSLPAANPDRYEARLGAGLVVDAARGVLSNDTAPAGATLSAAKATDPGRGSLTAFGADGSFAYRAPDAFTNPAFGAQLALNAATQFPFVDRAKAMDVDGDGFPDIVFRNSTSGIGALRAKDGALIWSRGPALPDPWGDCTVSEDFDMALGDVDDDGSVEIVIPVHCRRDSDGSPGASSTERIAALVGRSGLVKWVSERLGTAANVKAALGVAPTIVRLGAAERPSILVGKTRWRDSAQATGEGCDAIVPGGPTAPCRVITILNGADGTLRTDGGGIPARLYSAAIAATPLTSRDGYRGNYSGPRIALTPAMAVDLDGDGQVELVYAGAVFNAAGSVRWENLAGVISIGLANVDDDPDIEVVTIENATPANAPTPYYYIAARKASGSVLWRTPIPASGIVDYGSLTIGDLDGDGRPDFVTTIGQTLYAFDHLGRYRWSHYVQPGRYRDHLGNTWERALISEDTQPLVHDLDGDGVAEVILQGIYNLWFIDGVYGTVKSTVLTTPSANIDPASGAFLPPHTGQGGDNLRPLLIDVDKDGTSAVAMFQTNGGALVGGGGIGEGYVLVRSGGTAWKAASRIHHQNAFWPGSALANGTVVDVLSASQAFRDAATNAFATQPRLGPAVDPNARAQDAFTYVASAFGQSSAPATVSLALVPANRAPVITSTPPTGFVWVRNGTINYYPTVVDPDGDPVTLSVHVMQGRGGWRICTQAEVDRSNCAPSQIGALTTSPFELQNEPHAVVIAAADPSGATGFQIVTLEPSAPPAFAFQSQSGVPVGTVRTSNTVAPAGFTAPLPIGVTGGEYSIDCAAGRFTAAPGVISPGDSVCVRHTASSSLGATVTTTLDIGGITATFSSTTTGIAMGIAPLSLDFGGQSVGTTSPARTVTISSAGLSPLVLTAITVTSGFTVTGNCGALPATVPPGGTCNLYVTFGPSGAGGALLSSSPVSGTLTVTATEAGSTTVDLAGKAEKSLVTHYYRSILRRAPDEGGKTFWDGETARVQALGLNVNEVWFAMAQQFYASAEYLAFGRNNEAFVTDLFNTFFNRSPDQGGQDYWVGQLNQGMPREVVLAAFMFSAEFANFTNAIFGGAAARAEVDVATDFYRGLLARLPDDGGFAYWLGKFRSAQCAANAGDAVNAAANEISGLFTGSAEYAGRGRNDAQYVGDLYNAFLRRGGDLAGVQYWIGQLEQKLRSRDNVRQAFVASPEFQARVAAVISQGCQQ